MSVSNSENILLEQLHGGVIADDTSVKLGVVGLGQGDYLHGSILDLHLQLGVLLGHDRELDADVTSFGSSKQTFLRLKCSGIILWGHNFENFTSFIRGKVDPSAPLLLITTIDP